ncbi:MAG: hypothetical protein ACD_30C00028G0006 [uncultured bacterium]|uniref:ComEC/Rec2-related protein n=3 Tax=Candidatus Daviesiibacteriota TaxID=1752718 RepID=A0A0G0EWA2_9BACT|nr:MAG: hypothetical protein ACD_30C00028G0006 [uncultured bacterium]KKQ09817.1 MAG: ComEC/Rec2-related protein [Candidatus Daviesbacteria bacterium GW2011_GWB1_36_5]KKQ14074.1 MAG: ComEC/Rec2-related protein [Candidatus Daviesbacteria bacterium GW2011_GWA1_36_8]OGE32293.1 MAG: hypothetical protein A3C99_03460 [Candidatus Daviesbacteria bacterium RIFCSPHIGHO2_02_FULL_37_9]OGE35574.1 MAG: hypothetical protein A3E66_02360 [Candidatus Daviesbacteria bacterium RIFCSPHIGHO2_12_FULL_37_16]
MLNSRIFLILLLTFILILRIQSLGGLHEPEPDPFLEEIGSKFESQRNYLSKVSQAILPQPQAALLTGMVLGVKEDLPFEFKKALSNTSTMHIVVVSGQNLTLLGGFLLGLAPLIGRKKTLIVTLIFLIFYSVFTGLQIPVLRAVLMFGLASIAQILGRADDSPWVLMLTALAMLIYNPSWLLSISFQLSFLATVGVIILAPALIEHFNFLPNLIKQDLVVTTAAQIMVFPIIAVNFHQMSIFGILVNSLILWTVPIIMLTGMATFLISIINIWLAELFGLIPGVLLTYFVYIVDAFNQPWANMYVGRISWIVWIGYYLIILGIYLTLRKRNTLKSESQN